MSKFLKVLSDDEYLEYLTSRGIYKYIPKKILYIFSKHINPSLVCSYKSRRRTKEMGLGIGICINQDKLSEDEYKKRLIDAINNLKQIKNKDISYLIDEGFRIKLEDIKEFEKELNIEFPKGKKVFAQNLLFVLKKICKIKHEELSEKEVFIISDDTKVTEDLVNILAASTKFISIYSRDENLTNRLEKDLLEKTGLALNIATEIDRCAENFDFIINLKEDINLSMLSIKKNSIAFDLSNSKCLSTSISKASRKSIIIEDLLFTNDNDVYSDDEKYEFDSLLNTSLSGMLGNTQNNISKIQINGKALDIESGINLANLEKQNQSCFKKIE